MEKNESDIAMLYEIVQRQSQASNKFDLDYSGKLRELKSYLTLQHQIGSLKKYRYDQEFHEKLSLSQIQDIYDTYIKYDEGHSSEHGLNQIQLSNLKKSQF